MRLFMSELKKYFNKKLNEENVKLVFTTTDYKGIEQIEKVLQSYNIDYNKVKNGNESIFEVEVDTDKEQKLRRVHWASSVKIK